MFKVQKKIIYIFPPQLEKLRSAITLSHHIELRKMLHIQQLTSLTVLFTVILLTNFLLMLPVPSTAVSVSPHRPFPKGTPTGRDGELLVELRMNGAEPKFDGELICHGFTIEKGDEFWVKQFRASLGKVTPHHIGIYACDFVPTGDPCFCPLEKRTLVYSNVRHTPPHRLPPDVGFHVGGNSESQFLFLEIHYRKLGHDNHRDYDTGVDIHITRDKQKYVAGYYSPMAIGTIPPHKKDFTLEACIKVDRKVAFHVFSYQPHGHSIPKLVSGYRIGKKSGDMAVLGRGNPLFPEAHYVEPGIIDVEPGDTIIVRCFLDSSNQSESINTIWIPEISNNKPHEMCIFHLMYYADSSINTKDHYKTGQCTEKQITSLPKNSKERLPANALLEEHAISGDLNAGIIRINQNITMNMELEDFESLFGPYSKKEKTVYMKGKQKQKQ